MIELNLKTNAKNQMINIDDQVQNAAEELGIKNGVLTVYCPHTTAGITINENADPHVQEDILNKLDDLAPQDPNYKHAEGNSDGHIKSSLVGCSQQVIVENGKLKLGTWQSVFFCEFDGPRSRKVWVQ